MILLLLIVILVLPQRTVLVGDARPTIKNTLARPAENTVEFANESLEFVSNENLIDLPGAGTKEDPYRLEGANVLVEPPCVVIRDIDAHMLIQDCIFVAKSTESAAVLIENSRNIIIRDVEIRNGRNGVWLLQSDSCMIESCNITGAIEGITSSISMNNTIENSSLFRNTIGMMLQSTNTTLVRSNSIFGNSQWGIQLDASCRGNEIYYNHIGWNAIWRTVSWNRNAVDHGANNTWDDGVSRGNNYTEFDQQTRLPIPGTAGAVDRYPSELVDYQAPVIDRPEHVSFAQESLGNSVTWSAIDRFPAEYAVRLGLGRVYAAGHWHSNISVNLDDLSVGMHNMTIEVKDYAQNATYSFAIVYVSASLLSGEGAGIVIASSLLSVVAVALLISGFKKLR